MGLAARTDPADINSTFPSRFCSAEIKPLHSRRKLKQEANHTWMGSGGTGMSCAILAQSS